MHTTPVSSIVERGVFDPKYANETAVYAAWTTLVIVVYLQLVAKYQSGPREWALLLLGIVMPAYALRYVFFGTRWGSNSSFALVNLTFTSFCPARVLLPCPDSDASQCQLGYPKVRRQEEAALATPPSAWVDRPHDNNFSTDSLEYLMRVARLAQLSTVSDSNTLAPPVQSDLQCLSLHKYGGRQDSDTAGYAGNLTAPDGKGEEKHRPDMQFPVLVPLWQIYVRERPLPIFLHTSFMTVAALLWPLQLWKAVRKEHPALHRSLGYLTLASTALGSLSAAPYAVTYLLSAKIPETITGAGYLEMYSFAAYFFITGIKAARNKEMRQHQVNMVRLVGLSWGVTPLGRLLTVTPPIIWLAGPWNNAVVVCLSWPLGIMIAQKWLL